MRNDLVLQGLFAGYLAGLGKQAASQEDVDNFESILKAANEAMQKEAALTDTIGMGATWLVDLFKSLMYKLTSGKGRSVAAPMPKKQLPTSAVAKYQLATNPNLGKPNFDQQPRKARGPY